MISLNYVFMPWISNTFRRDYLNNADPRYSILRASYADLFIMNTGYSFVYNSQQDKERSSVTFSPLTGQLTKGWQLKFGIEAATASQRSSRQVRTKPANTGCLILPIPNM